MASSSTVVTETLYQALPLIPLIPFVGSMLTYVVNKQQGSALVATLASGLSFICVLLAYTSLGHGAHDSLLSQGWVWFQWGPDAEQVLSAFSFRMDHLSAVMCLVITGVGTLIHVYSIGYMHDDPHKPRFFAYLNLFLAAMLVLVLGDNLLMMFIGWEGVGLCSYLLIGFWFTEMDNAKAGQKAFVVNRIGDAGFLLGMFLLVVGLQDAVPAMLSFKGLESGISSVNPLLLEMAALLLFIGAVGKSAQIPLFVWLPDAMAGPTPVSALIHAATMVTAGVYMITRLSFLYSSAPVVLTLILTIGTLTAFVAASIALVQNDIKKVLAYSTVSQLGYMFMALGAGAFSNGVFHVVTHAFFKACLFMGAGSVIIGCHHEQDMRKFGGLRKKMPFTFWTYLLSTLAIAGFPYTSGFFSKDAVLWTVFSTEGLASEISLLGLPLNTLCWSIGMLTAFMTAFYMTRSLALTFFGEYRGDHPAHESPLVVTIPLVFLAALSIFYGYFQGEELMHYLEVWGRADMLDHDKLLHTPWYHTLEIASMAIAVTGITLAFWICLYKPEMRANVPQLFPRLYSFLSDKWRIDELYDAAIIRPLHSFSKFCFTALDRVLIDGTVNGTGIAVEATGDIVTKTQAGRLNVYALWMFVGMLILTVLWLLI